RATASPPRLLFLFQSSADPRELHSFPTRRSSDLQQLVQMSGVEQSIQTNRNLETLITAYSIQNANNAVSLLGKSVTGSGTGALLDRKSTRLNSSHVKISYAVFCLKKKKKKNTATM